MCLFGKKFYVCHHWVAGIWCALSLLLRIGRTDFHFRRIGYRPKRPASGKCNQSIFVERILITYFTFIQSCLFSYINERNRKRNIVEAEKAAAVGDVFV